MTCIHPAVYFGHDHFFATFIEIALSEHFLCPSVSCSLNIMLVLLPVGCRILTNLCLLHEVVIPTINRVKDKQKSVKNHDVFEVLEMHSPHSCPAKIWTYARVYLSNHE